MELPCDLGTGKPDAAASPSPPPPPPGKRSTTMMKATAIAILTALHALHASAFLQTHRAMAPAVRPRSSARGSAHAHARMAALAPGSSSSVCVVGLSDVLTQLVIGKLGAKEGWDVSVLTQVHPPTTRH